jgi:hypothetical protein
MIKSQERSIKPFKNRPNPRRGLTENGQIPEDDLPRMAKSRKTTYREWPNPGRRLTEIGPNPSLQQAGISKEDLMKPAF